MNKKTDVVMTWKKLIKLEPFLEKLRFSASQNIAKSDGEFFHTWFSIYKPMVTYLVGWDALDPALRNGDAYDIAYCVISETLAGNLKESPRVSSMKVISDLAKEIMEQGDIERAKRERIYEEVKRKKEAV